MFVCHWQLSRFSRFVSFYGVHRFFCRCGTQGFSCFTKRNIKSDFDYANRTYFCSRLTESFASVALVFPVMMMMMMMTDGKAGETTGKRRRYTSLSLVQFGAIKAIVNGPFHLLVSLAMCSLARSVLTVILPSSVITRSRWPFVSRVFVS